MVVFAEFPSRVISYASAEDFTDWTEQTAPANATALLRSASMLVRRATITAIYDADSNGIPTDGAVLSAFRDATCAQVAAWVTAGIDPAGGGVATSAPVRSKKLGSGSVDYDTSVNSSVAAFQAKKAATSSLTYEAWLILSQAGLVTALYG